MPYPTSPFKENFNISGIIFGKNEPWNEFSKVYLGSLLRWLCTSPKITSFRVNTLKSDTEEVLHLIKEEVKQFAENGHCEAPKVIKHPVLPDVVLLYNINDTFIQLEKRDNEVIVDHHCAVSIMRGAQLFAPGVVGMLSGTNVDDEVSIYADLSGKCKKGLQKEYTCTEKLFIGNGIVKMKRHQLFGEYVSRGVAVEITDTISGCPSIKHNFLSKGVAIMQNIPSIVCVLALNPTEGESVLDMCAAPGNKTTHIAALMKNKGYLVAVDRSPNKIKQLQETCNQYGAKAHILQYDSTKLMRDKIFPAESFDKILLDAPCSALGQRPQLINTSTEKALRSYRPHQKKLFYNAVHLLKINGRLVYSTCTITVSENEEIVKWALATFECLELIKPEPFLGGIGFACPDLTNQQRSCLQRFGPEQDSIGFFIVVFVKNKTVCI